MCTTYIHVHTYYDIQMEVLRQRIPSPLLQLIEEVCNSLVCPPLTLSTYVTLSHFSRKHFHRIPFVVSPSRALNQHCSADMLSIPLYRSQFTSLCCALSSHIDGEASTEYNVSFSPLNIKITIHIQDTSLSIYLTRKYILQLLYCPDKLRRIQISISCSQTESSQSLFQHWCITNKL